MNGSICICYVSSLFLLHLKKLISYLSYFTGLVSPPLSARHLNQQWLLHTLRNKIITSPSLLSNQKLFPGISSFWKYDSYSKVVPSDLDYEAHIIHLQLLYHNLALLYEVLMLRELSWCQWYFFSCAVTCQRRANRLKVILTLQRPFD